MVIWSEVCRVVRKYVVIQLCDVEKKNRMTFGNSKFKSWIYWVLAAWLWMNFSNLFEIHYHHPQDINNIYLSVQLSRSVMSTLCECMDCSMPDFPVHDQLPELAQTHVHRVGDAIQSPHPLPSPSPAFNLSQHQGFPMSQFFCIRWPKYWSLSYSISPSHWIFSVDFF